MCAWLLVKTVLIKWKRLFAVCLFFLHQKWISLINSYSSVGFMPILAWVFDAQLYHSIPLEMAFVLDTAIKALKADRFILEADKLDETKQSTAS